MSHAQPHHATPTGAASSTCANCRRIVKRTAASGWVWFHGDGTIPC